MNITIVEKDNHGCILSEYDPSSTISYFSSQQCNINTTFLTKHRLRIFRNIHINMYLPNTSAIIRKVQLQDNTNTRTSPKSHIRVHNSESNLNEIHIMNERVDHESQQTTISTQPTVFQSLITIFLPSGYPRTVRSDYKYYQIYCIFQAFCSSISSLFANRSVLDIVGVGDEDANSTVALYYTVMQQVFGRLTTILFAWKIGEWIEPECKKWRFMGDIYNDGAILLDVLVSLVLRQLQLDHKGYSTNFKVLGLLLSSVLRALCAVVAAGSKAALTVHFTLNEEGGSISDVSAKQSSQETAITLCGMLVGTWLVYLVPSDSSALLISSIMIILTLIHLYTNFKAVASVVMTGLNRQRATIVFGNFIASPNHQILSPRQVSKLETIVPARDDELFIDIKSKEVIGFAKFVTFGNFLETVSNSLRTINDEVADTFDVESLLIECHFGYYVIWPCSNNKFEHTTCNISVLVKEGGDNCQKRWLELIAWLHALLLCKSIDENLNPVADKDEKKYELESDPNATDRLLQSQFDTIRKHIDSTKDTIKELTDLLYDEEKTDFVKLWNISTTMVNPKNLSGEVINLNNRFD